LHARVKGLREELEPEVSLVVDSLYPSHRLVTLLRDFHAEFPTVPVRLLVQPLGGVERAVRSGAACIGVGSPLHMDMTGLRRMDIPGVQIIPVAAPGHRLAAGEGSVHAYVRDFVHLVLSEQPLGNGRDFGVNSLNNWRIGDLAAKHQLLLGGLGWGGMPEPMVRADIETGRLVRLKLRDWRGGQYTMLAMYKADTGPGRAGQWLIDRLATLSDETDVQTAPKLSKARAFKKRRQTPPKGTRSRRK
jgi:DNA-binding transcriptional LysR family regulator